MIALVYDPVRKMPTYYNSFQQAIGASQEIFRFIDEQDEVRERKKAIALKNFQGSVEFRNVRFGYSRDGGSEGKCCTASRRWTGESRGEVVALVRPELAPVSRRAGQPVAATDFSMSPAAPSCWTTMMCAI